MSIVIPQGIVNQEASQLIERLNILHPEISWSPFELGDYVEYAEIDAPDVLVSFGSEDEQLEFGLVDPYANIFGEACEPAHWGISEEAAQLIQKFNKVFMALWPTRKSIDDPQNVVRTRPAGRQRSRACLL